MSCDIQTCVLHWQWNQRFMKKTIYTYISLKHNLNKDNSGISPFKKENHRWATVPILIKVSTDLKFCLMKQTCKAGTRKEQELSATTLFSFNLIIFYVYFAINSKMKSLVQWFLFLSGKITRFRKNYKLICFLF